ncbi:hypothetical protein G6F24_018512 [Rhizopus arrhizus]|nr:hypothetical protein G6F24_018512 [Rhizopus arrhizus]
MLVTWMSEKGRTLVRAGLMFARHAPRFSLLRRSTRPARHGIAGPTRYPEAAASDCGLPRRCRSPWPGPRRGSSHRPVPAASACPALRPATGPHRAIARARGA